ncbi:MAG: NAD+ synthase [Nitrospirae bacterium]|nr:NAD+ synthase [Nitrospirota bacterium]
MRQLRLAMAQMNCTVGDLEGNARKIVRGFRQAQRERVDLVIFPELAVTGYPPEDLLLRPAFVRDNLAVLEEIVPHSRGLTAVIGFVDRRGKQVFNAAAVCCNGVLADVYHKVLLPNYGVFDEQRYFTPGRRCSVYRQGPLRFGVNICEDIWDAEGPAHSQVARGGARLVAVLNASPFHAGKWREREEMLVERARAHRIFLAYNNLVGGQDELVFDGHSLVLSPEGEVLARGRQFEEDWIVLDLPIGNDLRGRSPKGISSGKRPVRCAVSEITLPALPARRRQKLPRRRVIRPPDPIGEIYQALCLGTADYIRKNGFRHVVVGLSGGVDSALTATIAVDALGKDRVTGVFMPSPYTSRESREDTEALDARLGIPLLVLPIQNVMADYFKTLGDVFRDLPQDVTEENLQARIRGNLLMAISNKFKWLVLTTGNKSEMSVGYATLYGDMAGGFAVLKDVHKTLVYALVNYRNKRGRVPVVPERILTKDPTAELRPGQKDTDSLPPYDVLDPILKAYVEEDMSPEEIVPRGFDPSSVRRVIGMVDQNEYKRRQAPPGIKITPKAFGRDRRMPITNRYRT